MVFICFVSSFYSYPTNVTSSPAGDHACLLESTETAELSEVKCFKEKTALLKYDYRQNQHVNKKNANITKNVRLLITMVFLKKANWTQPLRATSYHSSTPTKLPGSKHNGNKYKNQLLLSPEKGPTQLSTGVQYSKEWGEEWGLHMELGSTWNSGHFSKGTQHTLFFNNKLIEQAGKK